MFLDADAELEAIDAEVRHVSEVLTVRLEIYRGLEKWELMQTVAGRLAAHDPDNAQLAISLAYATRRAQSIDDAKAKLLWDSILRARAVFYILVAYSACREAKNRAESGLVNDNPQPRLYRAHPEQYRWADRDFRNGDRVVFVGPPNEQFQPAVISPPSEHKLLGRVGTVMMGPSEDIRCDPDDSESDSIWVRFDNDKHPLRQVSSGWLVREDDYRQGELG